ncbi:MAG: complex I subunit 5 family protein [Clostridium sp.]|nr:complex I subunit 5 family protein [Acetatifactor muris]MCM1562721.1 complex I subunit 5 family protein [Clostridium sp.]
MILDHLHILVCAAVFGPMVCAVASWLIGRGSKVGRDCFVFITCGLELSAFLFLFVLALYGIYPAKIYIPGICGPGLAFAADGFRVLYGTVAAFMWLMTTLFSREYFARYHNQNRYWFFFLLTLGATEGVFLAGNFFTIYVFFEIMSLASYAWVAHEETAESLRAAGTYLAVAVIGGLVMLMGVFLMYGMGSEALPAASLCLLVGFGAKAGAFPLHIWLPKAHPVAPAPASALLSGVLTKTGVFGILLLTAATTSLSDWDVTWGTLILTLGVLTMVLGALLALFSVDLKRTLACSSVSQIGFVLVGIGLAGLLGEERGIAVRGAVLHMVNHSLIKLVLFLAAGVVFMNPGKLNLNEIRGFGRKKPLLNYCFLMGALGIGGIPLWNGYVSKTLLHESIVEYTESLVSGGAVGYLSANLMRGVEWAFLISGGLTVAYMTKLYVALFIEKNRDGKVQRQFDALKGKYMNRISAAVLAGSATLLPLFGMMPDRIMGKLADLGQSLFSESGSAAMSWFAAENLKGALISIAIGAFIYLFFVRTFLMKGEDKVYVNRWPARLDLEDSLYRPVLLKALPFVFGVLCRIMDSLADAVVVFLRGTVYRDSRLPGELEEGNLFTHICARVAGAWQNLGNRSLWKKEPRAVDYEHKYALIWQEWDEDSTIIGRSLSFGLLLFCVGLLLTVIYLLVAG